MKAKDIREFNINELQKKETDMKQELFNLRFQNQTGQLENPFKIKDLKKDIARVKTVLKEKMKDGQDVRANQ